MVGIRVLGPKGEARLDGLVDTGADETLLPMSLAEVLGVTFHEGWNSQAVGIAGDILTMHYGDVGLQLETEDETIAWQTTVAFVELADDVVILGHGGCLDYFTAIFDGERAELELRPNAALPLTN